MLCERMTLLMQSVTYPEDNIIDSLERGALRDFDNQLHGIHNIKLERLILLADKIKLKELIADIIPYFFEFWLQRCAARVAFDLPTDPERSCQRRPDVRDSAQTIRSEERRVGKEC